MKNFQIVKLAIAGVFVALMLSGCQLMAMQRAMAPQGILSPGSLGQTVSASQRLILTTQGKEESRTGLQLLVEIQAEQMQLAALSSQGLRLFVVTVTGSGDAVDLQIERHAMLDDRMEQLATLITKDYQRIYWPVTVLNRSQSGVQIQQPASGIREVYDNSRLISRVEYADANNLWQSSVTLQQVLLGYALTITPLDVDVQVNQ